MNGPLSKMLTLEKQFCIKAVLFPSLKMKWECPALAKLLQGLFLCVFSLFFSAVVNTKANYKESLVTLVECWREARDELFQAC